MTKKRKSRGRTKGSKGRGRMVQCSSCGKMVPRDKAKKATRRVSFLDYSLAQELKNQGAYLGGATAVKYYCISCAVHRGITSQRAKKDRKTVKRKQE